MTLVPISTTTLTVADLVGFSQGIAQLNLGYLGISVAILGVLGGVFVYFNIKPLKDGLDKQEKSLEDLRTEARGLLSLSKEQSDRALENFKQSQNESISASLKRQKESLDLETTNKVQNSEKVLTEKIEIVSEEKDTKLKEILLSEVANHSALLEKALTSEITKAKEALNKELAETKQNLTGLGARLKEAEEKIKELQVYKFSKEGRMGAIIYSIDLLKDAVDEYLRFKKDGIEKSLEWKVSMRLKELTEQVGAYTLETRYIAQIEEQLARIDRDTAFAESLKTLRLNLKTG